MRKIILKLIALGMMSTSILTFNPIKAQATEVQQTSTTANTSNIKTVSDLVNYLNTNHSTLNTPIGTLKFKFTIQTEDLGLDYYDYWVQTDFGEISNSKYGIAFFSPYLLEYSNKISSEDKEATKLLLKQYQQIIGKCFIEGIPNKRIYGGFYTGFYKYPALKVGYESTKFLTWSNYDEHGNITDFHWDTLIDDYDFTS